MENENVDLWGRHRITTRLLALALIYAYIHAIRAETPNQEIVFITGLFALIALIVLTFGLNSITKVTGMIKAWRNK